MRHALALSIVALLLAACGSSTSIELTSVSGDVMPFGNTNLQSARIADAEVCVLEQPGHCVRSSSAVADRGHFQLDGIPVGSQVTLTMAHAAWPLLQTATLTVPAGGLSKVTFQAPSYDQKYLLALAAGLTIDDTTCQLAATVTMKNAAMDTLYVYSGAPHGEPGATVLLSTGSLSPFFLPIYFNDSVVPEPGLTQTSTDGGVLYGNLPPGTYTLTATKTGVNFRAVTITCRAGWIVNASPNYGLQAY
jgi:hypothetical protein